MIIDENEKKDEINEKFLVGLCECYLLLNEELSYEVLSICIHCLLKAASDKEKKKEIQKDVEIALLALSNIYEYYEVERELYLNEIKEIIKYHQKHHNLTRLAYQSAWQFLIIRLFSNRSLEGTIANELHFIRETRRELEELKCCVDWKKKEKQKRRGEKEGKEEYVLIRWLQSLDHYFRFCQSKTAEHSELIGIITQLFRAATDNHKYISARCLYLLRRAADDGALEVEDILKGGAIDATLEGISQPTFNNRIKYESLVFFTHFSRKLKEEGKDEVEEAKRKLIKRRVFEKMEEEGYEDIIASFHKKLHFLSSRFYYGLSLNISDYFVYA
ncbi:uncharacterized protein MONOS_17337 [Monocercomonoides exilis]|uniref:uncharacterized protein n=1 Tax=Monocercomonoides exilis TaxID=2049356 RepID=UPI00355971E0|nr:hypothetical protein MONOS_17337 [Monocercomonoides exilis]